MVLINISATAYNVDEKCEKPTGLGVKMEKYCNLEFEIGARENYL